MSEDKQATWNQATHALEIISATGAKREDIQAVCDAGLLSDLFRAAKMNRLSVGDIDRRDFRNLLGIYQSLQVNVSSKKNFAEVIAEASVLCYDEAILKCQPLDEDEGSKAGRISIELIPDEYVDDIVKRDLSIHAVAVKISQLGYRFATSREFISLAKTDISVALNKRGIIGARLENVDGDPCCMEFCWRPDEGPELYTPRIIVHHLRARRHDRWWVAGVRIEKEKE